MESGNRIGQAQAGVEQQNWMNDARMETIMGRLLQVGVLLAAVVVLAGGVMYMAEHSGDLPNYRRFVAAPIELRHPGALLHGIGQGDASAIVDLGILLLVATPICRVIFAAIAFAVERDRLYVAISLTVLAVLLYGMLRAG
jgi:uncharacterized membrane protein